MRQALRNSKAALSRPLLATPLMGVAMVALLAGCTMGPNFHPPKAPYDPASFLTGRSPATSKSRPVVAPINAEWWRSFDDPELDSLERRAVSQNLDVKAATIRVVEARADAGETASAILPSLKGQVLAAGIKPSDKGLSFGSSPSSGSGSINPFGFYQYGFDASWTLDIWGKVRRQVEAANAAVQASEIDERGVLIQMMAEVARDYVQLRNAQMQLKIADDNVNTARKLLNLTRQRAAAGLTDQLDVAQEQAQLTTTEATVPAFRQHVADYINALSLLLGEPPRALQAELSTAKPVPPTPAVIPIGLPSELLRRRPDIMEAEAKLHEATANIGVSVASFFPSFNLLGFFGIQADNTQNLFTTAARTYTIGGGITVPIFEGGKLVAQLNLSKAQQREAMVNYDKTVLQAFSDVDNALTNYDEEQQRRTLLARAVSADQTAFNLARDRYTQGIATYIDVLNAQQNVLSSQRQYQDSTAAVSTDLVALYLALGGGWEDALPTPASEAAPDATFGQALKTIFSGGHTS